MTEEVPLLQSSYCGPSESSYNQSYISSKCWDSPAPISDANRGSEFPTYPDGLLGPRKRVFLINQKILSGGKLYGVKIRSQTAYFQYFDSKRPRTPIPGPFFLSKEKVGFKVRETFLQAI